MYGISFVLMEQYDHSILLQLLHLLTCEYHVYKCINSLYNDTKIIILQYRLYFFQFSHHSVLILYPYQYLFLYYIDLPEVSPIHQAVIADSCTSTDEWLDIVSRCQESGYEEAGIEVLAAITVLNAMKSAKLEQGIVKTMCIRK